jgi:predicted GIY-YIG superfamily endonuclease
MAKHNHEGKTWYVYELIDTYGSIIYVGCSYRPHHRFKQHTLAKKGKGVGYFYGRLDLTLHIVAGYAERKIALQAEGALKLEYGMPWTERDHLVEIGRKVAESGQLAKASRDNWKNNYDKMLRVTRQIGADHTRSGHIQEIGAQSMARSFKCPHCAKEGKGAIMLRWHFDKCKKNTEYNA